ncbi:MAG TPA: IPT/TIG domain-containing protein [Kofleriaceae bacterium]|nr:IPT/TIG domain-containing protein [Kofleriaceae bacterium]
MSIPSITRVRPRTGPTSGHVLVEILGEGLRLPPASSATGPAPPASARVQVRFGGALATDVRVYAADRLTCRIPIGDDGPCDVVVDNLDEHGMPIPGEQSVARGAFTYVRPALTIEADLTRLVRTLLHELKRQVIENVVLTVHTDFDADAGAELHLATVAALPALVIVGPELAENRFFSLNQFPEHADEENRFSRRRHPYTVDLSFSLVGVSHHTVELLNLMAATQLFFHKNKYLTIDRDSTDADAGSVRYEMDLAKDGDLKTTSAPNASNIRSFSGRFVVRGFDLEDLAGFADEGVVERGATAEVVALEAPERLRTPAPRAAGGAP